MPKPRVKILHCPWCQKQLEVDARITVECPDCGRKMNGFIAVRPPSVTERKL